MRFLYYNKKQMGCECLGPKKSNEEVFIKIIKSIHHESSYLNEYETGDQSILVTFSEKLNKQGDLRKFAENLSSRKNKIKEALALNYKLAIQNKQLGSSYSSLLILSSISDVAYPKREFQKQPSLKSDLSSDFAFMKKSSEDKGSKKLIVVENNKTVRPDPIVDEQYFKLMKILYNRDKILKKKVMEKVNKFCENHPGYMASQVQLWGFMSMLINDLKNGFQVQLVCKTMRNLLLKTKDQINELIRNRQMIQNLLILWLEENNKNKQSQVKQYCYEMLDRFFDLFVSALESQFLCECIFSVYDAIQFNQTGVNCLQELCEDLIQSSELKSSFRRYMFNYLLGYLLISHQYTNNKKWLATFSGVNAENAKIIYKNTDKFKLKIEGVRRIDTWIDKRYIDINQYCAYNSKILIYLYTNFLISHGKDEKKCDQILSQLMKTLKKMSQNTQLSFLETTLQQFQDHQIFAKQQQSMLKIIKSLINSQIISRDSIQNFLAFCPMQIHQQNSKKMEIANLNMFILDFLTNTKKKGRKYDLYEKVGECLGSFYENFVSQQVDFKAKLQILQKHNNFVRQLQNKKQNIILSAYEEIIYQKSKESVKKIGIDSQFYLLLIGFNLRKILTGQKIPQKLINLSTKIQRQQNKDFIVGQLNTYFFNPDRLEPLPSYNKQKNDDISQCIHILNRIFSSNKIDRLESLQRRNGFSRCISIQQDADVKSANDRSFQQAIDILNQK